MLIKYNFQISYIRELENGRVNILNKKSKSHIILTVGKLELKYNKL